MRSSLPHQSTLIKKSVFDEMGNYNEALTITSDREFFIKCLFSQKYVFTHIPYLLTLFDRDGRSNDPKFKKIKLKENEAVFKTYYGIHFEDYKNYIELIHENNRLKRNKIRHFYNRLRAKIKRK